MGPRVRRRHGPQLDLGSVREHFLHSDRFRPEALYRPLLQRYLAPFSSLSSPLLYAQLPTDSFVILNRAGTTPVQYSEWLVDASISKTGAGVWYGPVQAAPPLTSPELSEDSSHSDNLTMREESSWTRYCRSRPTAINPENFKRRHPPPLPASQNTRRYQSVPALQRWRRSPPCRRLALG
jgi:hypothetical protein